MKTKSFNAYLLSRLNKQDIADIESAAQIEYTAIQSLKSDITQAIQQYMSKNGLGFNDLVRKCGKSPAQVSKIIKGEANLTITSIAQLFAMMGKIPHIHANK